MLRCPNYMHDSLWAASIFIVRSGSSAKRTERRTPSYSLNEAIEVRNKLSCPYDCERKKQLTAS